MTTLAACRDCGHDGEVHGPDGCQAERYDGTSWACCGCELYLMPEPELRVGDWGTPAAPKSGRGVSRSPDVDAIVEQLKANPGREMVVDRVPGRGTGRSWAYQARGCGTCTRRDGHWTLVWAWWPADSNPDERPNE